MNGDMSGDDAAWCAEAGNLTIVVQGGVSRQTLLETAEHSRHWRELFPSAEIILSVSSTDILTGFTDEGDVYPVCLDRQADGDETLLDALADVKKACDRIALALPAGPLPPLKTDSPKLNNVNFQIAAAQRGLSFATRPHVLRIRSDSIFLDRGFLDQYAALRNLPRGPGARFSERILISSHFTVNPYTAERMPFHFSDWFNFGTLSDVSTLWDVPFMTIEDATYYDRQRHDPTSNALERVFRSRLAVEQHIAFHCVRRFDPSLCLDRHNDLRSREASLSILVDDFMICDLQAANFYFPKYQHDIIDPRKEIDCLTQADWRALAVNRETDPRTTLADKIAAHEDPLLWALAQPFPHVYPARRLRVTNGIRRGDAIVSTGQDGVFFFGPYSCLPQGTYVLAVRVLGSEGVGRLTLRATADSGKISLGAATFRLRGTARPDIALRIAVEARYAEDFEVVCSTRGIRQLVVSEVTVDRLDVQASREGWIQRLSERLRRSLLRRRRGRTERASQGQ